MPVTPDAFLISNGGRLDPVWFEPHDLTALLTAWLTEEAHARDDVTKARVYHRAFTTAADLIMSEPATQSDRSKSSSYSAEQIAYWRGVAAEYADEVDALLGRGGPVITPWEGKRCVY